MVFRFITWHIVGYIFDNCTWCMNGESDKKNVPIRFFQFTDWKPKASAVFVIYFLMNDNKLLHLIWLVGYEEREFVKIRAFSFHLWLHWHYELLIYNLHCLYQLPCRPTMFTTCNAQVWLNFTKDSSDILISLMVMAFFILTKMNHKLPHHLLHYR